MDAEAQAAADLAATRTRFNRMLLMTAICGVVGLVSIIAFFALHVALGLWGFIAALVCGFAAQVWFVATFRSTPHR